MKQYRITSQDIYRKTDEDTILPEDDIAHDIMDLQFLGGLGGMERIQQRRLERIGKIIEDNNVNISHTSAEKRRIEKERNIQPGTPEWFELWFSRPYMTGSKGTKE